MVYLSESSQTAMKPLHLKQRILKEKVSTAVPLLPLSQRSHPTYVEQKLIPHEPFQGGTRISPQPPGVGNAQRDAIESGGQIPLEKMKRRIKELEVDNLRLRNHVHQAEEAIKNYRGVLTSRSESYTPIPSLVSSKKRDANSQTDPYQPMNDRKDISSDSKLQIQELEQRNRALETERQSLYKNRTQQSEQIQKLEELVQNQSRVHDMQVVDFHGKIQHLEKELRASLLVHVTHSSDQEHSRKVQKHLRRHRKVYRDLKQQCTETLKSYKMFLNNSVTQIIEKLMGIKRERDEIKIKHFALSQEHEEVVNKLTLAEKHTSELLSREVQLMDTVQSLQNQNNSFKEELELCKAQLAALDERQQWLPPAPASKVITADQCCDPLSPMAQRYEKQQAAAVSSAAMAQQLLDLEASTADRVKTLESNDRLAQRHIERLVDKLGAAQAQLDTLKVTHAAAVKGVQHVAHIKDLGRIAAARELTLERDKILGELNNTK